MTPRAATQGVRDGYGLGEDFYALWLDPTLTCSCALWEPCTLAQGPEETLAQAQRRKLDYIATGADVRADGRVLDIGCGWGSMMRHLIDARGARHVVGLTLSESQAAWVAGWRDPRCEVWLQSWSEHEPSAPYDAIVSIGAFEHFAAPGPASEQRLATYDAFFERCRRWLPPGGRLALQTIVKGSRRRYRETDNGGLPFARPARGAALPCPSEILQASERGFEILRARNDAAHYARTAQVWLDTLSEQRGPAGELVGADTVAECERSLASAVRNFADGHLGLLRIFLARS